MLSVIPVAWGFAFIAPEDRAGAIPVHVSIGLIVVLLTLLRLAWRKASPPPPIPSATPGWMKRGASIGHFLLYALILVQGVLGIWMAALSPVDIRFFNLFNLSELAPASAGSLVYLRQIHFAVACLLTATIFGHVAAALWHHFLLRDDVLIRMLPFGGLWQRLRAPDRSGRRSVSPRSGWAIGPSAGARSRSAMSQLQPFAPGDIFVTASLLDESARFPTGEGRIRQYGADWQLKAELATGHSGLISALVLDPAGWLHALDPQARAITTVASDGQVVQQFGALPARAYGSMIALGGGEYLLGEHMVGEIPGFSGEGKVYRVGLDGSVLADLRHRNQRRHGRLSGGHPYGALRRWRRPLSHQRDRAACLCPRSRGQPPPGRGLYAH